jgi:two-component system, LuxR family, response regulator FixJ
VEHSPTVFVINENPAVLSSIGAILTALTYDVKSFASDEEFIAQLHPNLIGCIVIDLATAAVRGSVLIRHLHETGSQLSVVIISGLIDVAVRYQHENRPGPIVAKAHEEWTLLTMIEDAVAGSLKRKLTSMQIVSTQIDSPYHFATNVPANEKILNLSPRQRQVLSCLLAGDSLKKVSQKLEISVHTVGDYVKQIYKHFAVSSRAELAALFIPGDL